ncbi:MAG TPA: MFS transporter [Acetobacteraceae bacterium]|nr:MFS transporter [Acetobacteraceae bacterium]
MEQVSMGMGVEATVSRQKMTNLAVFASLIGTTIEWYDFFLYGTVTGLVFGKLFFPAANPFISLLLAYTTYAVGFASRPVGGVLFGHFGDRIGRKPLLVLTLSIMGVSTFLIGLLPTYQSIGIAAPVILLLLRLLQGIGLGGEWGGAVLMAFEYAPKEKRGFYACVPQVGLAIGLCLSTGVVALLSSFLSETDFIAWGWRVAFMLSIVLVAVGLFIRLRILETPEFAKLKDSQQIAHVPVKEIFRDYRTNVVLGWGARYIDGVVFNIYAVFTIAYLVKTLHFAISDVLLAITIAAFLLIFTIPIASRWSDQIGRRRVFGIGALISGILSFPMFWLMQYSGSVALMFVAIIVPFAIVYPAIYGPEAALFCELFDTRVRYSGISIVYQLSGIVSSAITPLVATLLLAYGGGKPWLVASYMLVVGIISAVSVYFMRRTF